MRFGDVVECATTQYPTYAVWRDAELLITYAGLSTSCRLKDDCDRSTPGHDCCVSVWLLSVSAPSLWKAILSQPTPIEGSHGQPQTLTKFCLQASTTRTLAIPDNPTVVTVVFAFDGACSSPLLHATHLVEVACWFSPPLTSRAVTTSCLRAPARSVFAASCLVVEHFQGRLSSSDCTGVYAPHCKRKHHGRTMTRFFETAIFNDGR